jgi:hypothetical protein
MLEKGDSFLLRPFLFVTPGLVYDITGVAFLFGRHRRETLALFLYFSEFVLSAVGRVYAIIPLITDG